MTALGDALRKKYKTPEEAIAALGLDAALIATDPPVSEKQRKAMFAAASGHSTLGIPKKVGEEFVGKDKAMKTAKDIAKVRVGDEWPKQAKDAFEKMVGKDKADEFCAKDWDPDEAEDESEEEKEAAKEAVSKDKKAKDSKGAKDKKAMDAKKAKDSEEEEPEEVNEGKKDVKQSEDKKAMDKKAKDESEEEKKAEDKHAMDEAIKASGAAIEKAVTTKIQGLYAAADAVRPYIGEVSPMAFDSGDAIKVHALEKLGVKEASKLSGAALDVVLGYQQKAGARPVERTKPDLAMDSSAKADALKYAPGLAKQAIGV